MPLRNNRCAGKTKGRCTTDTKTSPIPDKDRECIVFEVVTREAIVIFPPLSKLEMFIGQAVASYGMSNHSRANCLQESSDGTGNGEEANGGLASGTSELGGSGLGGAGDSTGTGGVSSSGRGVGDGAVGAGVDGSAWDVSRAGGAGLRDSRSSGGVDRDNSGRAGDNSGRVGDSSAGAGDVGGGVLGDAQDRGRR
jgi:hypothetical protein